MQLEGPNKCIEDKAYTVIFLLILRIAWQHSRQALTALFKQYTPFVV